MTTGPETEIRFPFRPSGTWREAYDCVELTRDGIRFNRELRRGEVVFMGDLHSPDPATRRYEFSIRNLRTGAGIRTSGSGELSHMVFWAHANVACLEPHTSFQVFPGETGVWQINYELLD